MPELPEVETVVRVLRDKVINKKIIDIKVHYSKIIKTHSVEEFKSILINKKIDSIDRIAKHIIFNIDDIVLVSHLRMEGKYYVNDSYDGININHILIEFVLDSGETMMYHDTRKFGTYHLQNKNNYKTINPIYKVAQEAWKIKPEDLYNLINKRSRSIKTILLDQTIISGLGNIYVDEVLFKSKIYPGTKSNKITLNNCKLICKYSEIIFKKSIKLGGSSISSYSSSLGIFGKYQNELLVHTKENKPCFNCKTLIKKIKVNGRGTYFCPKCQKEVI